MMNGLLAQAAEAWGGEAGGFPAPIAVIAAFAMFYVGLRFYAKFISRRLFDLEDDDSPTPAVALQDDVDFVPSPKEVVFGHHFTSIAGAAPIVGPAIGVFYGWLPAFLWIVIGVIFMGAMQDFGALAVSMRNRGRSIGDLAGGIISGRARTLFLLIVLFLAWIVLAVFAMVIAGLFVKYPQTVVPINIEIVVAVIVGVLIYRLKMNLLVPSLVVLAFLYGMVFYFADAKPEPFLPSSWPVFSSMAAHYAEARMAADGAAASDLAVYIKDFNIIWWLWALLIYSFVASVLPVWVLLQPRDFINSHQLFLALGLAYVGFFVAWPTFAAPAINFELIRAPEAQPIFPFLFVLVACGAISGFHALIASGTTSKQVKSFRDARVIGYGGMLAEGAVALLATMACAAGVSKAFYTHHYASFGGANSLAATLDIFILGCGNMLEKIGIPHGFATAVVTVMVISFAATTLDSATRIMRYIVAELGEAYGLPILGNRYIATGLSAGSALALALLAGSGGKGGLTLWPLFGSMNQLTAALALMVIAVYLHRTEKPKIYFVLPMIFVSVITFVAMVINFRQYLDPATRKPLLAAISGIIIVLDVWLLFEGAAALLRPAKPLGRSFLEPAAADARTPEDAAEPA